MYAKRLRVYKEVGYAHEGSFSIADGIRTRDPRVMSQLSQSL